MGEMSMVERVARAIMVARGFQATAEMQWDDGDGMFQRLAAEARAAIEAMREPTASMIDAGDFDVAAEHTPANSVPATIQVWISMIDAALTDREG